MRRTYMKSQAPITFNIRTQKSLVRFVEFLCDGGTYYCQNANRFFMFKTKKLNAKNFKLLADRFSIRP
jgi:hypothetical protein